MCLFTRFSLWLSSVKPSALCGEVFKNSTTESTGFHRGKPQRRSLVRNHSLYFGRVRIAYYDTAAKPAFALLVFRSQDMAQKRVRPLNFSSRGFLEALGGAFVCF
jgi:hypothetical protein